jgi:hypothetical protein
MAQDPTTVSDRINAKTTYVSGVKKNILEVGVPQRIVSNLVYLFMVYLMTLQ